MTQTPQEEELLNEIRFHERWMKLDWYTALTLRWIAITASAVAAFNIPFKSLWFDAGHEQLWAVLTTVAAATPALVVLINTQIPYEASSRWHTLAATQLRYLLGLLRSNEIDESIVNRELYELRLALQATRPQGPNLNIPIQAQIPTATKNKLPG